MISTEADYEAICHMHAFSDIVNLLSSAPGTVSHLQCSTLGYDSCEMLKKLKNL